jgi:hypothetical protein
MRVAGAVTCLHPKSDDARLASIVGFDGSRHQLDGLSRNQLFAPLTTKFASRAPLCEQRSRLAQSGTGIPEPCWAT